MRSVLQISAYGMDKRRQRERDKDKMTEIYLAKTHLLIKSGYGNLGSVLLISSKMDTMWPSQAAAEQVMKRLQEHDFPYFYRHLSYDYGSHITFHL